MVLKIEYEGTRYHGFQLQGKLPTIQRELETALFHLTGTNIRVVTASRTDAGVHAKEQVVSFRTESDHSTETFVKALNYYLPGDIAVREAYRVRDSFDVRRHAVSREYYYRILNGRTRSPLRDRFCYLVTGRLDVDAMNDASRLLLGEHDFASFVNNKEAAMKSTVRTVYRAEMRREEDDMVIFYIKANSFLMHQVRNTVGSLLRLGREKISREEFKNILEAKEPGKAWPTAPARGLSLIKVNYKNPIGEEK
ncbi:MAG: tRNA pseudouridine(38-40) synthase TruA [Dehalococcoidales bacterium]|nr:tRNA pseudouridine(38-40) synthase TruA [Dehalococcoidales bacterium]